MLKFSCCLILILLCGFTASAKVRLVEWHTKNTFAPFILPVRDSETPEQASRRYLKSLSKNSDLMELFQGQLPVLETVQFKELSNSEEDRDLRVLMQANRAGDYANKEARVDKFSKYYKQLGQTPYLLLLNPTTGLKLAEERQVFDLIYEKFAMYAGIGGDDVDPVLAKQENFHSRGIVPGRDAAEIRLIKHFVRRGQEEKDLRRKSFYFGTCRGSQLAAVALGYKLIQDIPFQVGSPVAHANDWHKIKILPNTQGLFSSIAETFPQINVNSLHHQSVKFVPGGFLELIARSSDGITEGTVFRNGRGALLQFHAELMDNALGFSFLKEVVRAKDSTGALTCSRIFAN